MLEGVLLSTISRLLMSMSASTAKYEDAYSEDLQRLLHSLLPVVIPSHFTPAKTNSNPASVLAPQHSLPRISELFDISRHSGSFIS
jgi:glyoxylase-like metal-dependent hydrolase (beta-lactamase superfamily II)